jgi:hypothetical protein
MRLIFLLMLAFAVAFGQVPDRMHLQGNIVAAGGTPLNGDYAVDFYIYDAETAGDLLWSESHEVVTFDNGYYHAVLGSQGSPMDNESINFTQPYWLEIVIDGGSPLVPRTAFLASAYAMAARAVIGSGNVFPADGPVGIGVVTPSKALEVDGTVVVEDLHFSDHPDRSLKPVAFGSINVDGSINALASSDNFTIQKLGNGVYNIIWIGTLETPQAETILQISTMGSFSRTTSWEASGDAKTITVYIFNGQNGQLSDSPFTFFAFKP